MRIPALGVACLFGAAWLCFCISADNVLAARPAAALVADSIEATEVEKEVRFAPPSIEEPIPIPFEREDSVELEKVGAHGASAFDEHALTKVFEFAQAYPANRRPGTMTAVAGLVGFVFFMAIHVLTQSIRGAPIDEDVFFKKDTSSVTFSGAGAIMSLAVLSAGLGELLRSGGAKPSFLNLFSWPSRGKEHIEVGLLMIKVAAATLVAGWLLGFPVVLMEGATGGLLGGFAFAALGLLHMTLDVRRAMKFSKQLYTLGVDKVAAMEEDAIIEPHILASLVEHFVRNNSEKGELMRNSELLDTLTGVLSSFLAKAETPEGAEELEALVEEVRSAMGATPELLNSDTLNAVAEQLQQLQLDQLETAAKAEGKAANAPASEENEEGQGGDNENETEGQEEGQEVEEGGDKEADEEADKEADEAAEMA